MGLGLSTGGKEGENTQKGPRETPSRDLHQAGQLAAGSPRHPAGAPPALPGERRRFKPGEEEGQGGAAYLSPEMRGGLRDFRGARGPRKAAQGRNQAGCRGGAPHLGERAAATTGPKCSRLGGEGREGRREEGERREGERADGRPPRPPAAPAPRAAAAGLRRARARARARAPGPGPGPARLLRYLIISTLFLQMFISCFAYHVGAGGPMRAGLARHWRVSLGQVPEVEYLFFQSLGLLKKSH